MDPTNLRPMLFLEAAREIMLDGDWPYRAVTVVLREHGFSLDDIQSWGGEISYDQPMPNHPSRIGRLERGELDAIFDEGIVLWADLLAVDYSGWPIYCRTDTPAPLVEKFCHALDRRRDHIPWDIGGPVQPPLPLERMVQESPVTPLDVPLHPQAAAVWRELGYL